MPTPPLAHPRIWFTNPDGSDNGRLGYLQTKPMPGAIWTTNTWQRWQYVMKWKVTGAAGDLTNAITQVDALLAMTLQNVLADPDPANADGLYMRFHLRNLGWAYDVLRGAPGSSVETQMTSGSPSRRERLLNTIQAFIYVFFNQDQTNAAGTTARAMYSIPIKTWQSDEGPWSNHFDAQTLSATYAAVTTYGDNGATFKYDEALGGGGYGSDTTMSLPFNCDGVSSTHYTGATAMWDWLTARLPAFVTPALSSDMAGGNMCEGVPYGTACWYHLVEAMCLLRGCGFTYLTDYSCFNDAILFHIYQQQPGQSVYNNIGDMTNARGTSPLGQATKNEAPVAAIHRFLMLLLAEACGGQFDALYFSQSNAPYAQHWINTRYLTWDTTDYKPFEFLWWDMRTPNPLRPDTDWTSLPLYRLSSGMGFVNSRSSWSDDAISVNFNCWQKYMEHQHADCNQVTIYKGPPVVEGIYAVSTKNWLTMDATTTRAQKDDWDSVVHNTYTLFVPGFTTSTGCNQRYREFSRTGTTGTIARFCGSPTFVYAQGKDDNCYGQPPGGGVAQNGDRSVSDKFTREMVHVLPGFVITYDRLRLKSAYIGATSTAQARWHYPANPAVIDSLTGVTRMDTGINRLFRRTLLASPGAVGQIVSEATDPDIAAPNTWREQITLNMDSAHSGYGCYCNVFEATLQSQSAMTAMQATPINGSPHTPGTMEGVTIKTSPYWQHVLFSGAQDASTPSTIDYYVPKQDSNDLHRVFNLTPSTAYVVEETPLTGGLYRYTLTPNVYGRTSANSAGVAEFNPPPPPRTPTGVKSGNRNQPVIG